MNDFHPKRVAIPILLVLAILAAGSLYLYARTAPPARAPSATAPASNPAEATSTSSTQPKITWSSTSTMVILSPGGSATEDFTFTSNQNLQNVVIESVPQLAGFLTIRPSTFTNIPANQPQPVHASFSIPAGTGLGTYDGTIHLRVGSTTLPQTFKLTINVWSQVKEPTTGLEFLIPPFGDAFQLTVNTSTDGQAFVDFQLKDVPSGEFVSDLGITIYSNPAHLGLSDWFDQNIDVDGLLKENGTFQHQQLSDGSDALVLSGPIPNQYLDVGTPVEYAYRISPLGDRVVSITQSQVTDLFDRGYSQQAILNLELEILGTVQF